MEISIEPHTLLRAEERGASLAEIREVVESGHEEPARDGRLARAKVYLFEAERNGRYYPEKRIRVIYVAEEDRVATVTVHVYYGKWD